jgi:hypothetical protein
LATLREIEHYAWDSYDTKYVSNVHFYDGEWTADVDGHEVEICLDDDENVEYVSCNCRDFHSEGCEYCEHILAFSYEIIERIDDGSVLDESDDGEEAENVISVISELSRDELLDIAIEYVQSSGEVARKLFVKYLKPDKPLLYAKGISETILKSIKIDRKVRSEQASDTKTGLAAIRRLGDEALESDDAKTALELQLICLNSLAMAEVYDFTGTLKSELDLSMDRLSVFLELSKADSSLEKMILSSLKNTVTCFKRDSESLKKLLEIVFELNRNHENWSDIDSLLSAANLSNKTMLAYLKAKSRGEGDEFLWKNYQEELEYRRLLVERLMEKGEYETAESLCRNIHKTEFIEKRNSALKKLGDVNALKQFYNERLLLKDFTYYDDLKSLSAEEEWKDIIESALASMKDIDFKIDVFVSEKRKGNLLSICESQPQRITRLCKDLMPEFKDKAFEIYEGYITKETTDVRSDSAYRRICDLLDMFLKEGGNAKALALSLIKMYPTRKKFKEYLNRYI